MYVIYLLVPYLFVAMIYEVCANSFAALTSWQHFTRNSYLKLKRIDEMLSFRRISVYEITYL